MSAADFIEVTPGALSPEACAAIVARLRAEGSQVQGATSGGSATG